MGRRQLAQHLWSSEEDFVPKISEFLPAPIELAARPTEDEVALFAQGDRDALNPGVMRDRKSVV